MISKWGEGPHEFAWMYKTKTWRRLRESHLSHNPLCGVCLEKDIVKVATVVHHLIPHRGRWHLFVESNNLQSVCKSCHDGELQFIERRGYSNRIGDDGWPVDDKHPANK
jgi:5-methylcytosine-specific restriction protein A